MALEKIVIYCSTFYPNVGGLEYVMHALAKAWQEKGKKVEVHTLTSLQQANEIALTVIRNTSIRKLWQSVAKADIFVEANISLKTVLVGLCFRSRWWVVHHVHYQHQQTITGRLKNWLTKFAKNISVSEFVANQLKGKSWVISNCYNANIFTLNPSIQRLPHQLIFVGRLVSDKGVFQLLDAFVSALKKYPSLQLSIIGDGPEKVKLIETIDQLQLQEQVRLLGALPPKEVAYHYQRAQIAVVPSIWEEPFGVIVLEALACGCKVIATNTGGLKEAGRHFIDYVKPNAPEALAEAITVRLDKEVSYSLSALHAYLATRSEEAVADAYLNLFEKK